MMYSGKAAEQILAAEGAETFAKLGLDRHLSPTRRNGLHSMMSRIKALAAESIAQPA